MPMPSKHTLAVLISASLLAGCVVGPDYTRPELSIPADLLGRSVVEQRHARPNAELITWWAGFGDPQLTRLVTLALDQNLDLSLRSCAWCIHASRVSGELQRVAQ